VFSLALWIIEVVIHMQLFLAALSHIIQLAKFFFLQLTLTADVCASREASGTQKPFSSILASNFAGFLWRRSQPVITRGEH